MVNLCVGAPLPHSQKPAECQGQLGWSEATFLAKNPGFIFRKLIMNNKMGTSFGRC